MFLVAIDWSKNGSGITKYNTLTGKMDYLTFSSVKKNVSDHIKFLPKKDFKNDWDQIKFMTDIVLDFIPKGSPIIIEGYSFGSVGSVFDIAESCGVMKWRLITEHDCKFMEVPPTTIKKWATGSGGADKVKMTNAYFNLTSIPFELTHLSKFKSPQNDIIDSFWMLDLLINKTNNTPKYVKFISDKVNEKSKDVLTSEFISIEDRLSFV